MDRKHLAMALSKVPDPENPQTTREQVRTPGDIAAGFLMHAHAHGELEGRNVVDLGTGTGVLGIGALLLGARRVLGVELEPHLVETARRAAAAAGVEDRYEAIAGDVTGLEPAQVQERLGAPADTVIMNPPFGADHRSRAAGGDRVFLSLAFRLAPRVYSMHLADTRDFLQAYARDAGFLVQLLDTVQFPLPARFAHHRAQRLTRSVVLVRYAREAE